MKENYLQHNCNDNDALSFNDEATFKVGKFREALRQIFRGTIAKILTETLQSQGMRISNPVTRARDGRVFVQHSKWFEEGIECEILRLGATDWQKGKFRINISLEFCPENPEPEAIAASNETDANQSKSPLDDLRQKINQETQSQN